MSRKRAIYTAEFKTKVTSHKPVAKQNTRHSGSVLAGISVNA